jgi:N-terminal domain of toast_rack, DUF2154
MNRSKAISMAVLAVLTTVALLTAGCGISTGPTQELVINEPLGSAAVTDVGLIMGAGKLVLAPGADGLASGVISYNVEQWKPAVTRTDSALTIKQSNTKGLPGLAGDVVNDWDLKLGAAPIRLNVTAGAYEGTYELGSMSLQKLSIKDGASKSLVTFSSDNLSQMESLSYETGASSVTLKGLAFANFKKMDFKGGAGSFTLDFSGTLRSDGSVNVQAGVGSVHIIVPGTIAAKVTVKGRLSNVTYEGGWQTDGKIYYTPAAGPNQQGKLLTITVKMDLGSLSLTTQ